MGPSDEGVRPLTAILVSRPVTAIMASLAAAVFGLVSYANLSLNLMPDLSYPSITVRTEFPGAAPQEVETLVSRPIEVSLSTVPGLVALESRSRAGGSDVLLEFEWTSEMNEVAQAVRERLGVLGLPDEVKRPLVLRYDPSLDPILRLALVGQDDRAESLLALRELAEMEVRRRLEVVPGVAAVKVRGGLEREIVVEVNEGMLHARGLTLAAIAERLRAENINLAGGSLLEGQTEYLIRTLNEFQGPEEIAQLELSSAGGRSVRVGDLATVRVRPKDREVVGRVGGREAVEIAVYREADANIVDVSRRVRDLVFGTAEQQTFVEAEAREEQAAEEREQQAADEREEQGVGGASGGDGEATQEAEAEAGSEEGDEAKEEDSDPATEGSADSEGERAMARAKEQMARRMRAFLSNQLPDGVEFLLVSDQARFIEAAIKDVRRSGLIGGLLAVLVLFVFLRSLSTTAIIAVSIPISVVVTFAPMYLFGVSLNLMSLGGLALAIGMLVDNSIVVLESIHRCKEEGDGPVASAVRGTREVAGAVTASTLTTVAVFFPIAFVEGVAGQLFGHMALTVVFGLLASLAVALFLIPVLAARSFALPPMEGEPDQGSAPQILAPSGPHRELLAWARIYREQLRPGSSSRRRRMVLATLSPLALVFALLRFLLFAFSVWPMGIGMWLLRLCAGGGRSTVGFLFHLAAVVFGPAGRLFDRGYVGVQGVYGRLLDAGLRRPSVVLFPAVLLAGGAILLAPRLGTELLPQLHQGVLQATVRLPIGAPLERTLDAVREVQDDLAALPSIESVYIAAGVEASVGAPTERGQNTADITLRLRPSNHSAEQEERAREQIRDVLEQLPGVQAELSSPTLHSFRTPLEVEVRGNDLGLLREAADQAVDALRTLPGLRDVRSNLHVGYPEVQIRYDRARMSRFGLNVGVIAQAVKDKVAGNVATDLPGRGKRADVRVVLREADRDSLQALSSLNVNPQGTPPIPLKSVASLTEAEGPSEIRRADQERSALITADLVGFDLGSAALRVERVLDGLPRTGPDPVRFEVGGQSREMDASLSALRLALLLAVFLVYIIMASQFESVGQPLIILAALPLAVIGVVPGLWATGSSVSVVVLLGAIVLAGVVVNNAIVLVDYANRLRARGMEVTESVRTAGSVRLRPILISSLTTILGLLPLALGTGEGSEIRQPLAWTVIFGLAASTALTLLVVPVLYRIAASGRRR